MVKRCCVVTCDTGLVSSLDKTRSVFKVPPKAEIKTKWQKQLAKIGINIHKNSFVCEKHFKYNDVQCKLQTKDKSGNVIFEKQYKHKRLKEDAVPSLLNFNQITHEWLPLSESGNSQNEFILPEVTESLSRNLPCLDQMEVEDAIVPSLLNFNQITREWLPLSEPCNSQKVELNLLEGTESLPKNFPSFDPMEVEDAVAPSNENIQEQIFRQGEEILFNALLTGKLNAKIPNASWGCHIQDQSIKYIMFSQSVQLKNYFDLPHIAKKVVIYENCDVKVWLLDKKVDIKDFSHKVNSVEELERLLLTVNELIICEGGPSMSCYSNVSGRCCDKDNIFKKWRHVSCSVYLEKGLMCFKCASLENTLRKHHGKIQNRRKRHLILSPIAKRLQLKNKKVEYKQSQMLKKRHVQLHKMQDELNGLKQQLADVKSETVDDTLKDLNIPENQLALIREIIDTGKCSRKGRRYSKKWLLWCMLLRIRSRSTYDFLRKNNILPLPAFSTIYQYLASIDIDCGFNKKFLQSFHKKMQQVPMMARHGVLLLDEMSVRKSISVNSQNLTFDGLMDISNKKKSTKKKAEHLSDANENLADHALVLIFSSLCGKFYQPIASFASVGAVDGITLAQLAIQAIIEIEKCGGFVDAIVSDGATTNRKMWQELGISSDIDNPINYFTNPCKEERKVFVFSDVPHLFKCIRNRLKDNQYLKINGETIKWEFYEKLFKIDNDHPSKLKLCPKLTENHIRPSNLMKMRVSLATQIFSNSVATAIDMYEKRYPEVFKDCTATIHCTKKLNDLFDVLNRKFPAEGITEDSNDFKVLKDSLEWLNNWQRELNAGHITRAEFLTDSTAGGLRITILSTIDLCNELLHTYKFKYVLTAKCNQDRLEQFFGMVRQAGCQNDHPCLPTFLQLYRSLSMYYLIRPPKYGNCTITNDQPETLFSNEDFSFIFQSKKASFVSEHIENLKEKLNGLISTSDWECEDIFHFDHDYAKQAPSLIMDCIIYYVTGFICKKMKKITKCGDCVTLFQSNESGRFLSNAELVNVRSRGRLIHPNTHLVRLFQMVEDCFTKNVLSKPENVYDATITDVLENCTLTFPCQDHRSDVIAHCIHYYVSMRMRQWAKAKNQQFFKTNQEKKKLARLTST